MIIMESLMMTPSKMDWRTMRILMDFKITRMLPARMARPIWMCRERLHAAVTMFPSSSWGRNFITTLTSMMRTASVS